LYSTNTVIRCYVIGIFVLKEKACMEIT